MRLYGYRKRCPDILFDEEQERYVCRLVGHAVHGEAARRALFLGQGCCNPLGDWRRDVRNRDEEFPGQD